MDRLTFIILALAVSVKAPPGHHHHPDEHPPDQHPPDQHPPDHPDCHADECHRIDEAINNIGMHVDDHLCHVFMGVNCDNHILHNDEELCGSDGQTYDNHCLFAKARCTRMLEPHHYDLTITNHGPCVQPTTAVPTTTGPSFTVSSTLAAITETTSGSGSTIGQPAVPSSTPFFTADASATSAFITITQSATTNAVHNVLGGVFCQYRDKINCGADFNVICASNGYFYPNMCEFLKAQCNDHTLRQESDATFCTLPTGTTAIITP